MTLTPEALEPPPQGAGATAPSPTRPAVRPATSARPEPLVGDRAVAKHLRPRGHPRRRSAGGGWPRRAGRSPSRRRRRRCGRACAAPGCPHWWRPATSTLFGVAAAWRRRRAAAGRIPGPLTESLSTTSTSALALRRALGQLLGGVNPQRRLLDPRVVDHVGQLLELVETLTAQWGRHEGAKSGHDCTCWRTVTRVSAKEVTIGIDIGTTAVKAVAADEDGQVDGQGTNSTPAAGARPGPARARRRRGVAAGAADRPGRTGPTRRRGGGRHGDGAVADRRRRRGQAADARPAVRRQPRRCGTGGADTSFLTGEAVEFLRWTAREAPDAHGYWPATAVANHALAGEAVDRQRHAPARRIRCSTARGWSAKAVAPTAG